MLHEDMDPEGLPPLLKAEQELKRIDHLIFVSLKYTRTVDVFKSIIHRFVTTGDHLQAALLDYAKDQNIITEYSSNSALRAELVKKHYSTCEPIMEMITDYKFYRRLNRAEFEKSNEFRRHVTMTVIDGDMTLEIKMETLTEYYKKLKNQYTVIRDFLKGSREED